MSYFWLKNVAKVPLLLNLMPLWPRLAGVAQAANLDAVSQSSMVLAQYISESDTFKTVDAWELKRC